jgi:hypothetical protein
MVTVKGGLGVEHPVVTLAWMVASPEAMARKAKRTVPAEELTACASRLTTVGSLLAALQPALGQPSSRTWIVAPTGTSTAVPLSRWVNTHVAVALDVTHPGGLGVVVVGPLGATVEGGATLITGTVPSVVGWVEVTVDPGLVRGRLVADDVGPDAMVVGTPGLGATPVLLGVGRLPDLAWIPEDPDLPCDGSLAVRVGPSPGELACPLGAGCVVTGGEGTATAWVVGCEAASRASAG